MNLSISNVVGGGDINREVNLHELYKDIDINEIQYDPSSFPGMIFRFQDPASTIMLYTSGKYNLAGATSHSGAKEANRIFLSQLESLLNELEPSDFEIRYIVCTADLGIKLDLNKVMEKLGTEQTEYEPEQFPGLFYRPDDEKWLAIIFNSGRIVLDGGPQIETLEEAYMVIRDNLCL